MHRCWPGASILLGFGIAVALTVGPGPAAAADVAQEDLDSSLIHAAGQGDLRSFSLALGMGANLDAIDRHGNNAVLLATQGEQHAMLRMLLDKGVNPDARGGSGFTALTYATLHGRRDDVRLLLKAGADPNLRNAPGKAPLHLAAEFGRDAIIADLVSADARIDALNADSETPLIVAIRAGNRKAFDILLSLGADPSAHDKTGRSALFWAILENHEDMALALIEKDAGFDTLSDGYTPLRMARIMQHSAVVAALTQRGATE